MRCAQSRESVLTRHPVSRSPWFIRDPRQRTGCPLSRSGDVVPDSGVVEEPARDPVAEAAARRPDAPALIAGDTVLTWADLDAKVAPQSQISPTVNAAKPVK